MKAYLKIDPLIHRGKNTEAMPAVCQGPGQDGTSLAPQNYEIFVYLFLFCL